MQFNIPDRRCEWGVLTPRPPLPAGRRGAALHRTSIVFVMNRPGTPVVSGSSAVSHNPVREVVVEDGAARLELEVVGEVWIRLPGLVRAAQGIVTRACGRLLDGGVALALDDQGRRADGTRLLEHSAAHAHADLVEEGAALVA